MDHVWEIRNRTGRCWAWSGPADVILACTLPAAVDVVVRDDEDRVVARGSGLTGDEPTPMARLTLSGGTVVRQSMWPTEQDVGRLVMLPGGEIGELVSWWNAPDGSEWRWRVTFHNAR